MAINNPAQNTAIKETLQVGNKPTLEKWVESIMHPQKGQALDLTSLDLKTTEGLIKFLKSPLGKSAVAELAKQNAIKNAQLEEQLLQQMQHQALMHALMAYMLYAFLKNKAHAAEKINEFMRLEQEKLLHKTQDNPINQDSKNNQVRESLLESLKYYEKTLAELKAQTTFAKQEEAMLEQLLSELSEKATQLHLKHQLYKDSLSQFEHLDLKQLDKSVLDQHMTEISSKIAVHAQKVVLSIASEDKDAHLLKHQHEALNLQMAALKEILDIHIGVKRYVDAQGESVHSFDEAHFILSLKQKIVLHDNKYYLLSANQEWNTMNQEEKEEAHHQYKDNKHNLRCIKQQLFRQHSKEEKANQVLVDDTKTKLEANKVEQQNLANMTRLVQANQASAKHALTQPALNQSAIPTPVPSPALATTPRPPQSSAIQRFRDEVIKLKNTDNFMPSDLIMLAGLAPKQEKAALNILIKDLPKTHVPLQTQQSFKQFLNDITLNTKTPVAPNLQSPASLTYHKPSPLRTTLTPYK